MADVQAIAADAKPKLPRGVRLTHNEAQGGWVLLAPERVFKADAIAAEIVKRCTGEATFAEIVDDLARTFNAPTNPLVVTPPLMFGICKYMSIAIVVLLSCSGRRRNGLFHRHPGRGIELVGAAIERDGVRAIGAAERAAMGELGEQAERARQRCAVRCHRHSSISFLSTSPRSSAPASAAIRSGGAE